MQYPELANKLAKSPWPESSGGVIFLLDAENRRDQQLLEYWIAQHAPEGIAATSVLVDLADDRKPIVTKPLSDAVQQLPDAIVAPLRVSWTQSAKAIDSGPRLIDLLRGGERKPGRLRARQVLRRDPDRVHLVAGSPGSILEMADRFQRKTGLVGGDHPTDLAVFIARQAAIVLDMAERRLQGGRYKVPRYVAQSLRKNKEFNDRLDAIATERGISREALTAEVNEYFKEMISIPTNFWLDVWAKFCNFCLGLGYEPELNYRSADLEKIRTIVRNHPSALLWTHKTYIDGFVVPKILFDNNFPAPHFFGGANLNIPLLGFLVRRAGGIFIKRSFTDNEAYKATLRQYIGYLMEKRFPLTWSFEGTRSRLGKLMPPKYGVLKYVLEGCYNAGARDIHIIPVTVTYDLIRDAEEYAREQAGVPKAPESLGWLIGYVRSLARPMGKIYVDFGEPVVLTEAPAPEDRLAVSKVAFQVAVEANRVTPITFPAVVSMALLGVYPRALTEQEVTDEVTDLISWATSRDLRLSPDFNRQYEQGVGKLLDLMIEEGIMTRFTGGPATVYGIAQGRSAVASYYRNTIIHYFVNKAIVELSLIAVAEREGSDQTPEDIFWTEVDELRDLFKFEFFYPPSDVFRQEIEEELKRVTANWQEELARGGRGARKLLLLMTPQVAHMSLQMYAEAYSLGADLLASLSETDVIDQQEFVDRCMSYGQQAFLQRRISSEASMGKLLFQNAWSMLSARQLTDHSLSDFKQAREQQAADLNALVRRVEISRASAIASRGTPTVRDSIRARL